ncbi:ABC-F family ATP-binding cassette domain-containing protein [Bacillus timonensis]|nr:ABC-F family ATP-binding cassette domain-containing protein [Bacillus timonensis]
MKLLTVEDISKSYADKELFEKISFSITNNERIGLIGVNGTGKSTLLKIVSGVEEPDHGLITHSKGYTISYLSQKPDFSSNHTVLDQVFMGDTPLVRLLKEYETSLIELEEDPTSVIKQETLFKLQQKMDANNAWEASSNAKAVLSKLGITDFSKKVGELSGGQKKRVALAQCLIQTPDLLVLDEPTNHLDYKSITWLENYLEKYNGALLLVTHDRYFLDRVTNRILELDNGTIYSYTGNYASFLEAKALREEQDQASEEKRQNLYRRELAWIRRGAKARTTKQKARIKRFEDIENSSYSGQKDNVDISIGGSRLGKKVLEFKSVTKKYDQNVIIENFSFLFKRGDRIGIVGDNGSGKSTLLNILAGKILPDSGEVEKGQTVKIAYYTQENNEMNENQRMIEYIKETAEMIHTTDGKYISASQMLERFLFPMYSHGTPISKLSGGEKRRLYLLKILMEQPNVLLLDEPTNDLDTQTLTVLEDFLEEFPGVVITVSHDRYFLDKVAEQFLIIEGPKNIRTYFGSYTEYLEETVSIQDKVGNAEEESLAKTEKKIDLKPTKKKLSYNDQREWETIEETIALQEEKCESLMNEIENAGSNYEMAQKYMEEHRIENEKLEKLIERWTELSEMIEG